MVAWGGLFLGGVGLGLMLAIGYDAIEVGCACLLWFGCSVMLILDGRVVWGVACFLDCVSFFVLFAALLGVVIVLKCLWCCGFIVGFLV